MQIGIAIPIDVIKPPISVPGGGQIVGAVLLLFNEDDSRWYGVSLTINSHSPIFGPMVAVPDPPILPPSHTVTLPCPQDGTTHIVGVLTDGGGAPAMYCDQDNDGAAQTLTLSGFQLITFKDDGGAYTAIPS
jgi:hypothetical protein